MPTCPKCGSSAATALTCPACKATFARPLVFEESVAPVPSAAMSREINIDRRSAPRPESVHAEPAAPTPSPAPEPEWAQQLGQPLAPPSDEGWGDAPRPAAAERPLVPVPAARPAAPAPAVGLPTPIPIARTTAPSSARPAAPPASTPAARPLGAPARPAVPAPAGPTLSLQAPVAQPVAPSLVQSAPLPRSAAAPVSPPAPAATARVEEPYTLSGPSMAAPQPQGGPLMPPSSGLPLSFSDDDLIEEVAEPGADPLVDVAAPAPSLPRDGDVSVTEIHAEPGSAWAQIGSWLVDAMLLGVLFTIYLMVAQAIAGSVPPSKETGIDWLVDRVLAWRGVIVPGLLFLAALAFVYSALFHALGGRTLGKRLFGLTVVDSTGRPPRLALSAVRSLLSLVSAGLLMMGFVLVLFDRRRQALHDKLVRTFVVRLAD